MIMVILIGRMKLKQKPMLNYKQQDASQGAGKPDSERCKGKGGIE